MDLANKQKKGKSNTMVYLSGLDDIFIHKEEFELILPNIEKIINIVKAERERNGKVYKDLERKFVSLCFAIKMVDDDYEEIKKMVSKQSDGSESGVIKYDLQKLIYNYLSHIDSVLDYLDKFIRALKKKGIKYERKFYDFDNTINNLRNEVLHEGIPKIYVTFSSNSHNDFACYQWAGTIEPEENENVYIELVINDKRYCLQKLLNVTYIPMRKKVKEIMSLI